MKKIEIKGTSSSSIFIGESYKNINQYINRENIVVITDNNLFEIYREFLNNYKTIVIKTGESNKTLDTVRKIYNQLVTINADRSWFIVGFGGGIVCDITGYVATTYMRGLDFGFVSTTLLSQVDASTGGKNGVNFMGYKNMIGTFSQPEFVICDPYTLDTLSDDEFNNGLAEIIKHALIASDDIFEYLGKNRNTILNRNKSSIVHLVYESIKIKSAIVNIDEKEQGERRKLNFGHTIGHAIEVIEGISHGNAIAIGMVMAINLSVINNYLSISDANKCIRLIESYNLPISTSANADKLHEKISMDKKREGEKINFILLNRIGNAIIKDIKPEIIINNVSKLIKS